jgi:hypothetical protein
MSCYSVHVICILQENWNDNSLNFNYQCFEIRVEAEEECACLRPDCFLINHLNNEYSMRRKRCIPRRVSKRLAAS